jgi:predicted O-methyltransferase YrrM
VDSHSAEAERQLVEALDGRRIDYAFIDGDHTYDGVRQDFELCARHAAPDAIVAFHDVAPQPSPEWVESTDLAATDRTVHDFWLEVKQRFRHEECVRDSDQKGYGIGVVFLESPGTSDASEPDFASEGP